jgi:hypothetical protein
MFCLLLIVYNVLAKYITITSDSINLFNTESGEQTKLLQIIKKPPPGVDPKDWKIDPRIVSHDEGNAYIPRVVRGIIYTMFTNGQVHAIFQYNYKQNTTLQGPFITHNVTNVVPRAEDGSVFMLLANTTLIKCEPKTLKEVARLDNICSGIDRISNYGAAYNFKQSDRIRVRLSKVGLHDSMAIIAIGNFEDMPDSVFFFNAPFPHQIPFFHYDPMHPHCDDQQCQFGVQDDNFMRIRGKDLQLAPIKASLRPEGYKGSLNVLQPNTVANNGTRFAIILSEKDTMVQYLVHFDLVNDKITSSIKLKYNLDVNDTVLAWANQ